jgi:hypothetical protein
LSATSTFTNTEDSKSDPSIDAPHPRACLEQCRFLQCLWERSRKKRPLAPRDGTYPVSFAFEAKETTEILGDLLLQSTDREHWRKVLSDDAKPILEQAQQRGVIEFTTAPEHEDLYIVRFPLQSSEWKDLDVLLRRYVNSKDLDRVPVPIVDSLD